MSQTTSLAATDEPPSEAVTLPKKKKPLGWFFYVMMFSLVVVLLLGGSYTVWYYSAKAKLDRQISAARERGEPVWFSDLRPKPVPAEEDGGPLYLQAVARLSKGTSPNSQTWYDASERARLIVKNGDDKGRFRFDEPELQKALDANQEALSLLRQSMQRPYHRFDIDWDTKMPIGIVIEHVQKAREFSHLIRVEFPLAMNEGDIEGAVNAIDEHYRLAEVLREEPFLVSQLVRIAISGQATADLETLAGRTAISPAQFARLDQRLATLEASFRLKDSMLAERASCLTTMEFVQEAKAMGLDEGTGIYSSGLLRPLLMEEQAFAIQTLGNMADAADATGPQGRLAQRSAVDPDGIPRRFMLNRLLLPAVDKVCDAGLRHRQSLMNARLGLRVSQRFHATQKLPGTLSEVLDEQLKQLPDCLYSGKPLFYKVQEGGFSIYPAGDNGVDDGGGQQPDYQEGPAAFDVEFAKGKKTGDAPGP